jgi:hypothetical protein
MSSKDALVVAPAPSYPLCPRGCDFNFVTLTSKHGPGRCLYPSPPPHPVGAGSYKLSTWGVSPWSHIRVGVQVRLSGGGEDIPPRGIGPSRSAFVGASGCIFHFLTWFQIRAGVQVRLSGGGEDIGPARGGLVKHNLERTCETEDLFEGDSKGKGALTLPLPYDTMTSR